MGGLWVDFDQQTNIPGLFAAGEVDYQYHGANRLGANSLLSCIYGGHGRRRRRWPTTPRRIAAPRRLAHLRSGDARASARTFEQIFKLNGDENAYALWRELGDIDARERHRRAPQRQAQATDDQDPGAEGSLGHASGCSDTGKWANQEVLFVRQLWNMLVLARVITHRRAQPRRDRAARTTSPSSPSATTRTSSRPRWRAGSSDGPRFSWEDVDTSLIKLRARRTTSTLRTRKPRRRSSADAVEEHEKVRQNDHRLARQAAGRARSPRATGRSSRSPSSRSTTSSRC